MTEAQEIELEMERQEADTDQDLLDRMADAFDRAEKGAEVEAIWAVRDEYLEQLRAERDDMAQAAAMLVKLARNRADRFEAECDEHADRLRVTSGAYARLDAQKRDLEGVRDRLKARAEQAEATIERARALHKRVREDIAVCDHCDEDYPCTTVRAMDGTPA